MMKDTHQRSIIKGISWRIVGTIDTMVMAYIVTGELTYAIKIGVTEIFTKVVLFYLHERLWNVIRFGRIDGVGPTHIRSFTKGVSWRVVGTIDTIFISYLITGHKAHAFTIGGFEVFSKIFLYYVHERIWGKFKWGRILETQPPVAPKEEAIPEVNSK